MTFRLGARSLKRLEGIHPDLVKVVTRAIEISEVDFTVLEGLRTVARQKQLMKSGATRTMNSRHITGHAIDLGAWVGGSVRWDWPLYHKIAAAMKQAAKETGVPIRWGGTWKLLSSTPEISAKVLHRTFPDGPHFELPSAYYP